MAACQQSRCVASHHPALGSGALGPGLNQECVCSQPPSPHPLFSTQHFAPSSRAPGPGLVHGNGLFPKFLLPAQHWAWGREGPLLPEQGRPGPEWVSPPGSKDGKCKTCLRDQIPERMGARRGASREPELREVPSEALQDVERAVCPVEGTSLSVHLSTHPSTHPLIDPAIHPSILPSTHPPTHPYVH